LPHPKYWNCYEKELSVIGPLMVNFRKKFKNMFARERTPPQSSSVTNGSFYGIDDKTIEKMLLAADTPSCVYCIERIPDKQESKNLYW